MPETVADQEKDARAEVEGLPVVVPLIDIVRLGDVLTVPVGERDMVGLTVPDTDIVRLGDTVPDTLGLTVEVGDRDIVVVMVMEVDCV